MVGKKGKSGRKPKPQAAKELAGTNRSDREKPPNGAVKPTPVSGLSVLTSEPYCPVHIQKGARKEWRRVSHLLIKMGTLTRADLPALEVYCTAYGRWRNAETHLEQEGLTVLGGATGQAAVASPYLKIADDCTKQMRTWLAALGIAPSSRPKVSEPEPAAQPDQSDEERNAYFFDRRN